MALASVTGEERHPSISAPRSATPAFQAALVFLFFLVASWIVLRVRPTQDPATAALLMIAIVAIPGALTEFFIVRSWQDGLDFSRFRPSVARIGQKLLGLWAIFALILATYQNLPVYGLDLYEPVRQVAPLVVLWSALLSVPYVALVDGVQCDPEDVLWRFGGVLLRRPDIAYTGIGNWLLGWLIKAFFLPLMFSFLSGYIADLWAFTLDGERLSQKIYVLLYQSLYFVDVTIGALGYCMTFRLLGTHIRSSEPTLVGWVVALVCYPPFWFGVSDAYFAYDPDWQWGAWLWDSPVLYTIWGCLILLAVGVYVWATVAFGLRFSNLTNRGIITNGPYRYTKHPAYIAKNLSWWLIAIPFVPEDGTIGTAVICCVMLLGVNALYFLRAKTEERHLMADPDYRAYAEWIARHGIFRNLVWPVRV